MSVVEICGFNEWLLKLLPEHGCRETVIVQPGERSSHKTDRRDASSLTVAVRKGTTLAAKSRPADALRDESQKRARGGSGVWQRVYPWALACLSLACRTPIATGIWRVWLGHVFGRDGRGTICLGFSR
jgi:hypothetical protein